MADKKSYVDVAYDVLKDSYEKNGKKSVPVAFGELLLAVGQTLGINEEEELLKIASKFYTALTMDGRFVIKENNTWVLREHELLDNIHIDMNDVYSEDDEDEDESEKEKGIDKMDEDEEEKPSDSDSEEETEELKDLSGSDDEDENN